MAELRSLQKNDEAALKELLQQLTNNEIKLDIHSCLNENNLSCIIIEDNGQVIGFGSIAFFLVPTKGYIGTIQDIVVDKLYRGKGFGRKIMNSLIDIAKNKGINIVELTSNPKRFEARTLYESLGFTLRETGVFRLIIK